MYLPKSALVSKMSLTNIPKAYASIEWPVLGVMLTWPSYQTNNFQVTHSFKIHVTMPKSLGSILIICNDKKGDGPFKSTKITIA